jgi:hypothetical protein
MLKTSDEHSRDEPTKNELLVETRAELTLQEQTKKYDETLKTETKFYPSILNELGELNLLLLEKIYNTFENKGDKVFDNFRKAKYAHLKPRIVSLVGEAEIEIGKGPDRADESTVLIDGDILDHNLVAARADGLPMEGETDYLRLFGEYIPLNLARMMLARNFMTADEARKQLMKDFDSDVSLNFDTELEANLKFLDNLLGNRSIHSHDTSEILD